MATLDFSNIKDKLKAEYERRAQEEARVAAEAQKLASREKFNPDAIDNEAPEDKVDFAAAMRSAGVKKINQDKVATKKPIMDPKISAVLKEMTEDEKKEDEIDFFSTAKMQFVEPLDSISWKVPGLQYGVLRKLKAGEYMPQAVLDLHNHTIEQAYVKTRKFILRAYQRSNRCILIVHGKGEFSTPKALLKSYVAHWLKQMPEVLGYCTAMPYHGDKGATYVLIKKGLEDSNETRERLASRR